MSDSIDRLATTLADRCTLERELGAGGMATELAAESRGSAGVAKATVRCDAHTHTAETRGVARGTELAAESRGSATSER